MHSMYIAAIADLEVECNFCGKDLCEIKCPESIKGCVPSKKNILYLQKDESNYVLDKSHYFQIQGQMGVPGRQYCDLFVYTVHGSITLRVEYESSFLEELCEKLMWFWTTKSVRTHVSVTSL